MMLDVNDLFAIFDVDFENGRLFWLPRTPALFLDGKYTKERLCNIWNAKLANKEAFTAIDAGGYRNGRIFNKKYLLHHVIFAMYNGYWASMIDHLDGNRANNRPENLKETTKAENNRNAKFRKDNSSGYKCVFFHKKTKKWQVSIRYKGVSRYFGLYTTREEAYDVYCREAEKLGFSKRHIFGSQSISH